MVRSKVLMALLALAVLTGCEKREVFGERRITVQVVGLYLTSKTNSKVHLQDVKTRERYDGNRLSCSRNKAEKVRIGSLWEVTEVTYVYRKSQRYSTELVGTAAICSKSQ